MDEHVLIQLKRVQQGDEQALESLYGRYSRIVYSVALRVLRNPSCAEDVLQEIFMQIWRSPDRFMAAKGEFSSWLATVARNRSIDRLRSQRYTESIDEIELVGSYDLATHAEFNLMCEKARLLACMLSAEQQQALDLAYFEGMTHLEISQQTGCPLGTIKSRIRSALLVLRAGLQGTIEPAVQSQIPTR